MSPELFSLYCLGLSRPRIHQGVCSPRKYEPGTDLPAKAGPKGLLSKSLRSPTLKAQIPGGLLLSVEETKGIHFRDHEAQIRIRV